MKITLNLSDVEVKILGNDLLDIEDWFEKAKNGKINNCKKRLIREWHPKLMKDKKVASIPGDEKGFLNSVFSRSDYKNRAEREEEAKEDE